MSLAIMLMTERISTASSTFVRRSSSILKCMSIAMPIVISTSTASESARISSKSVSARRRRDEVCLVLNTTYLPAISGPLSLILVEVALIALIEVALIVALVPWIEAAVALIVARIALIVVALIAESLVAALIVSLVWRPLAETCLAAFVALVAIALLIAVALLSAALLASAALLTAVAACAALAQHAADGIGIDHLPTNGRLLDAQAAGRGRLCRSGRFLGFSKEGLHLGLLRGGLFGEHGIDHPPRHRERARSGVLGGVLGDRDLHREHVLLLSRLHGQLIGPVAQVVERAGAG